MAAVSTPLQGIRVIEFAGLAPAPLCGLILSDFGANVIRVDKAQHSLDLDRLARGKRSIAVDLKRPEGISVVRRLINNSDVVLEPFRAGVMERLGLGPKTFAVENPRLIYARLTGFGQTGNLAARAGHDINYLAISGILSMLGRHNENPFPPINLLGDFAGGSLICCLGILLALLERNQSGKGQIVDANIVEGAAYLSTWLWRSRTMEFAWGQSRGKNLLDGGKHFYETYKTKDGKYMSVGSLEPQFYRKLLEGLGLKDSDLLEDNEKQKLAEVFATKTRDEWAKIFEGIDACVMPILELDEAASHPHNVVRNSFLHGPDGPEPAPAPLLDRTPAKPSMEEPAIGKHTIEVLLEYGYSQKEVSTLKEQGVVMDNKIEARL